MNKITTEQLKDLLATQKEFDDRIPTLNLHDTKVAFMVEFFEWFNTLETFKNWKAKPGKPLEVQLDELADMLAFGLSIMIQKSYNNATVKRLISHTEQSYDNSFNFEDKKYTETFLKNIYKISVEGSTFAPVHLTLAIAKKYYSIPQLIAAYKKKMKRNHERQNGTADTDKGYV